MILRLLGTITFLKISYRIYQTIRECFWKTNLKRKHDWVLITGGGGGIGLEFAKAFRKKGMKVFIIGRNCSKVAEKLGGTGKCESLEMDFNDMMKPKVLDNIKYIIKCKNWSYLINNVAYRIGSTNFKDLPMSEIQKCINTGIYPIVVLTKIMSSLPKPPSIINITAQTNFNTDLLNINSPIVLPYLSVYEGINNFQQAFGASLRAENMDILNIMPGAVKTNNTKNFLKNAEPLVVKDSDFVKSAMRYIGKKGSFVVHWKHKLSSLIINIFPCVRSCCFEIVSRDIARYLEYRYN